LCTYLKATLETHRKNERGDKRVRISSLEIVAKKANISNYKLLSTLAKSELSIKNKDTYNIPKPIL
jgi:hypothetical protein